MRSGRGAFSSGRSDIAKCRGLERSDYADMSNDKTGEKPVRRKPKVSWVKLIFPGFKARAKAVADGKRVNIPVLLMVCDGGTQKDRWANCWMLVQAGRTIPQANPRDESERRVRGRKA